MKKKIVLIGTGRHAKVILDVLTSNNDYEIVGCISKDHDLDFFENIPVIGGDEELFKIYEKGIKFAFIAIGDNHRRKELAEKMSEIGFSFINAISEFSYISSNVKLGSGIAIMPGVVINTHCKLGDNVCINTGSTIDHDCVIDDYVHVAPGCNLAGNIVLGEGSFLGVGSKIIPGVQVGEWSVIGAGAVVTEKVPKNVTVVGIPAKVLK